jgi:hypothetical protein
MVFKDIAFFKKGFFIGGLVGLILGIFGEVGFFICTKLCLGLGCIKCQALLFFDFLIGRLFEVLRLSDFIGYFSNNLNNFFNIFFALFINLLGFILFGILIGWIVEKIKRK